MSVQQTADGGLPANADPQKRDAAAQYSTARNWLLTLPVGALLLLAILFGTTAYIHSQLLNLGSFIWNDYSTLRADMPKPSCNPDIDIDSRIQKLKQSNAAKKQPGSTSDSLFDTGPVDPEARRKSLEARRNDCRQSFQAYQYNHKVTSRWTLQAFRSVELGMSRLNDIGQAGQGFILVLLVMFGGFTALMLSEQIGLRVPYSKLDHRVSSGAQVLANGALAVSVFAWLQVEAAGGFWLSLIWLLGFCALALAGLYRTLRVPPEAEAGGSLTHAMLTIPLYCWLALVSIVYFFFVEQYLSGPTIQISKMIRFSELYTAIGLYVWVGMMLKHTRIAQLVFNFFHSWELRPEFVVILVVLAAAYPTAYTGASGIFVLAIGAVIYQELRIAGNRRQLAIASTAMSGSMGVVLSPCLMVVIIAALNRQVTTNQLYGWGLYVFLLSASIFCAYVYLTRKSKPHVANPKAALPESLRALVPLLPYLILGAIVIFVYKLAIDVGFNEFSAPIILPLMLLVLLGYDRLRAKRQQRAGDKRADTAQPRKPVGFANALRTATAETAMLMGALLTLMVVSVIFGGVMGRSGVMAVFPDNLPSIWAATAILVVILVIIGMIMDPYGAIILVSATIAPVAYNNGINPVHFWMIVLVAFELGYLSPPVALNQLLTRQVVGDAELQRAKAEVAGEPSFWRRHEALLLPIAVMSTSLLLVAFAPLAYIELFQ